MAGLSQAHAAELKLERFEDATFCYATAGTESMSSIRVEGKSYLPHMINPAGVRMDTVSEAPGRCISVTVVGYRVRQSGLASTPSAVIPVFKILEMIQNQN